MPTTLKERQRKAAATRAYNKRYPERRKASQARYYASHCEEIKAKMRMRYARQQASGETYYQRNRELVKAKARERYYRDKAKQAEAKVSMREVIG